MPGGMALMGQLYSTGLGFLLLPLLQLGNEGVFLLMPTLDDDVFDLHGNSDIAILPSMDALACVGRDGLQ